MIHFFEGFNWPAPSGVITDLNSFSEFNFGAVEFWSKSGASISMGSNGSWRTFTPAKRVVPLGDRLVIGYKATLQYGSTGHNVTEYATICFSPQHSGYSSGTPSVDTAYTTPNSVQHALPILQINGAATGGRFQGLSLRQCFNISTVLWYEQLPGVAFRNAVHYYEVVYDILNSKIEVWLDNFLVGTIPYNFTATQKAAVFRISMDAVSYYSDSSRFGYPICYGMYVADERLGPVKFGMRVPGADAEVSPNFKTAPYYNKINTRSDGLGAKITTTLSQQKALFSNPAVITGEVLGLTLGGRFSSLEQSAFESLGSAKLTLKSNGQLHQEPIVSIPKQSFIKTSQYFEKSPFTNQTWTADEVNAMLFGAEIVVDPKIVT